MRPRHRMDPYCMVGPTVLLLLVFFLAPLVLAFALSLTSWDLLTPAQYVGVANYRDIAKSGLLLRVLGNTMLYSVLVVSGAMGLGLLLALALRGPGKLVGFLRASIFSAYVVSWVAVALLFLWLLDRDYGPVSRLVMALGVRPRNWLGDPSWALPTLAAVSVWKVTGYAMIVFLAGLTDIPRSVEEAARLDGAGPATVFYRVTWPLLRPSAAFVATTSLIMSFQAFDVVRIMTQGGPVHSTELFVYSIYEQVFMNLRVGRASALAVVFTVVILGLSLGQLWVWRSRWEV